MRRSLLAFAASLALVVASCGGGEDPIRIGLLTDCGGFLAPFQNVALAGAELPLLRRGAKLAGPSLVDGVEGATVDGRPLELSFGCAAERTQGTIEARRLVETENVDVLIGPNVGPTGVAIVDYANRQDGVTFVIASNEMLGHLDPGGNVFSFVPTAAQLQAGLGSYAYRELGWRRAAIVAFADNYQWGYQAGFVAEFCSLGGEIVERFWIDTFPENVPARLAELPADIADGFFVAADAFTTGVFLEQYAAAQPDLGRRVILGGAAGVDPDAAARLAGRLRGVVTASDVPFAAPPRAFMEYASEFEHFFPMLADTANGTAHYFDLGLHNSMEAVLRALERVDGDLSGGQRAFRAALSGIELEAPNGAIRLDEHRQAISPIYLHDIASNDQGVLGFGLLQAIEDVDASFGGHLGSGDPDPDRTQPACDHGSPPAWATGE